MLKTKESKGITLIALIITIIVLLILAGVTISAINGNESALDKAQKAKSDTDIAEAKEQATLKATALIQEYMDKRYVQNNTTLANKTIGGYVAEGMDDVTEGNYTFEVDNRALSVKKGEITIVTGTIEDDGTITWDEVANNNGGGDEPVTTEYGLFDGYGVKLASWEELVAAPYYLDIEKDCTGYEEDDVGDKNGNPLYYVLQNEKFVNAEELKIPDNAGIKRIGDSQLIYSTMDNIVLPEGLESIGDDALSCEGTINIPSSLKSIGSFWAGTVIFNTCPDVDYYLGSSVGHLIFNCDIPFAYLEDSGSTGNTFDVEISNLCHKIGDYAFWGSGIQSIEIPDSVESIGEGAFENCEYLYEVRLPNGLQVIKNETFCNCQSLESVVIPNSVTSIGDNAFSDTNLESVVIPNSVTSIGDNAFGGVNDLYIDSNSIASLLYQESYYLYQKFGDNIENVYIKSDCYNSNKISYDDGNDTEFVCNGSADENGYYKYEKTAIEYEDYY